MQEQIRAAELTYEQAVEMILKYKDETGKSQSAIAREMGISDGALSAFLNGSYKAPHKVVPKVAELLQVKEQRKVTPKAPDFAETTVSRRVTEAISYCHLQGKIAVVYGDAGVGKTQAMREYLRKNSLAIGITILPVYASITGVNELIAEQLGVRARVARQIYTEIRDKLRGSGRVLIVDEAQHLTVRALDYLRGMSDDSGVGICFIGNEQIYSKILGSRMADFAQLFSRIGMRREVLTSATTMEDVRSIFAEAELSDEALAILHRIARTNYGLRGAVNVYVNAAAVFGILDAGNLAAMAKEMNIG